MLANWADEIRGQFIGWMNVAANFADPTLIVRLFFWFYVGVVKGIGHAFVTVYDIAFLNGTEKHGVGGKGDTIANG